ncbi:MAG TPA: 2,3-diaminopropionate biosynthesis protein SbnA [Herpetosiphonaceae bacterium]
MQTGIISTIGNTPLIHLSRMFDDRNFRLFAKLESFNPGGSIKDRPAYHILKQGLERGMIRPDTTVIESSSGNMGIGLAQVCAYLNLRFICVIDPKTTTQNIAILKAYGAEVDLVANADPVTGEFLQARLDRVRSLQQMIPNSWWANQYANLDNAIAHHQTMHEIATALDNQVDYLFCATSTCGTLRGCADYVQQHNLKTKIYGVDAIGSVIFGTPASHRLIPGHGASRRPELYQPDLADAAVHISDLEAVVGCYLLLRREAILAGGSSGAAIAAVGKVQHEIPDGANCVVILCDRGERYLDTIYSQSWLMEHFGDIDDLLDEATSGEEARHWWQRPLVR